MDITPISLGIVHEIHLPWEDRIRLTQLYTVVRVTSLLSWEARTIWSRNGLNRGWKYMSPPVVDGTTPVEYHISHGRIVRRYVNNFNSAPMDPISIVLLMPRNMLTPIPSSAHSSAMSRHTRSRGRNNVRSFSVPITWLSSTDVSSAPGPTVGIVLWNTTTCPPLPTCVPSRFGFRDEDLYRTAYIPGRQVLLSVQHPDKHLLLSSNCSALAKSSTDLQPLF